MCLLQIINYDFFCPYIVENICVFFYSRKDYLILSYQGRLCMVPYSIHNISICYACCI